MPRLAIAPPLALALAFVLVLLPACTTVPESVSALQWRDAQGDRGTGVRNRDWLQCAQAVESRRSALSACMAQKGWAASPPVAP